MFSLQHTRAASPLFSNMHTATSSSPFACGTSSSATVNHHSFAAASKAHFKRPTRKYEHTDRGIKIANQLAAHRNKRNQLIYERRGGSEEFERIMDLMDKKRQDLLQAREAKRHAAAQLLSEEEELDDDFGICSHIPVQHASAFEQQRLSELEERQRQIEQMEAEIEEYSRLAQEIDGDESKSAHIVTSARDPWDYSSGSDDDVQMVM